MKSQSCAVKPQKIFEAPAPTAVPAEPQTGQACAAAAEGNTTNKKWWLMQLGFLVLMVLIFNVMWTQMGNKIEDVRDSIKTYEHGLESLNKDVAELQQQVVVVMDAGSRHDGALRASILNQRNAVQEQLRLLQQQLQELDNQESQLGGAQ